MVQQTGCDGDDVFTRSTNSAFTDKIENRNISYKGVQDFYSHSLVWVTGRSYL